ncbi:Extracellular ligand-binding receptor [Aminomonas paucivorans DSM 12260]|uniref:Extracellular ligand-binding receptor n=1 Tax=Aminomonas paucivorans DSM 12260 TaxID=584708 RepID=E3CYX6_9BACT|nr:ABC transporter substrate-binding protein [Aminomonas paucivorans]EFQ24571.1 Extracellular ligand-binding receptor [Aminomonas paucivorans DSM 12260]
MNDRSVERILEVLSQFGPGLLQDPDQLSQLLEERCGDDYRRENFLFSFALREALQEGVPLDRPLERDVLLGLGEHLQERLGVSRESAIWVLSALERVLLTLYPEEGGRGIEARPGNLPPLDGSGGRPLRRLSPRQRFWAGMGILAVVLMMGALVYRIVADRRPEGGEFRLVLLTALTGPQGPVGQARLKAAQLAVDQINAQGGVRGYRVRLLGYDAPDPQKVLPLARKATQSLRPSLILAACGNEGGLALAPWSTSARVPLVVLEGGDSRITLAAPDRPYPYVFRLVFDDAYEGKLLAYFIRQGLGRRTAALFFPLEDPRGVAVDRAFEAAYRRLGGVVTARFGVEGPEQDIAPALGVVRDAGTEVLVFPASGRILARLLIQAREAGFEGPVLGGTGYDDSLWAQGGSALNRTWWLVHAAPGDPGLQPFLKAYRQKYRDPLPRSLVVPGVLAYDGVKWAADALERASSYRPDGIRHALAATRNLSLAHGTLTIDAATHGPRNKAAALLYALDGMGRFQKRIWMRR